MFSPSTSRGVAAILPPPAHGVNVWCLAAARRCQLVGYSQAEAFNAIMEAAAGRLRAGRELSIQEVERAILTAYETPHDPAAKAPRVMPLPAVEIERRCPPMSEADAQAFIATSPLSPGLSSAEILATLFAPEDFIGLKVANDRRALRCRVRNLPSFFASAGEPIQFVTSSPISGRRENTQDGRPSYVAKGCFPAQRFVVVEFDDAPLAAQLARILFLKRLAGEHAPLVMVLSSGGKSLHSHFMPRSVEAADALKAWAQKLRADPAALRVNQLVRCPNQLRDNGRMQSLLWLSPRPSLQ